MSYSKQTWVDNSTPLSASRLNNMEAGIANADFTTCTSTTRPTTNLFDGMRIYETDTKAFGFYDVANATWHMWDTITQTFTVTAAASGGGWSFGNSATTGKYRRLGKLCWVKISVTFGSTINGGSGVISFGGIPAVVTPDTTSEQWVPCKLYTAPTGANWQGVCLVGGTSTPFAPFFPASASASNLGQFTSSTGAAGTGIPNIGSNYPAAANGNLTIEGTYETAAG